MCPTIRIDDEVYKWLQSQAVPFDDNPNSVLRRLAGLSESLTLAPRETDMTTISLSTQKKPSLGRRNHMAYGNDLLKRWIISAAQGRFARAGSFYQYPTKFPVALCDLNGFIVIQTEDDLRREPRIKPSGGGKKLNVRDGISALPGYQRVDDPIQ